MTVAGTPHPVAGAPRSAADSARRLGAFFAERAPWRVYITYAVLWVLALEGTLAALTPGTDFRLGGALLAEIATVYLALLFIRVVDEQKDLEYDRVHNPGRPLPRGAIDVRELRVAMALIVVAELALTGWRSLLLAGWLLFDLVYICFLVRLERWSATVRDRVFVNLLVSYPVQAMLSVHIWLSFRDATGGGSAPHALVGGLLCVLVFMHFEFARKTGARVVPGATLYSNVVGLRGSVALTVGFALAGAGLALAVVRPWELHGAAALAGWLPVTALGFVWTGAERFASLRTPIWPPGPAMGYVAWLYLGVFGAALAVVRPGAGG
ncbi:hypothetical protein [Streptomyces sp. DASNCL29]|uniref:hypothetical protein n=1 Tax=Streptomyces sp. DASNCL29 TaxID=2583819 RepID=UPI00110FA147|nr:hypothetical protein [Streptomyces sp. DASNCL29]TMU98315.1 hypothetical protein FGK60_11045 [Streptomyces sp. DASNCL29]